ncbi:DUF2878 family protein [Aquihabitans sp. G128]|uniref:DUF2878 family protein n=1 Tax=Aquihabitans sp. G128 TaxID=2849779 RepID=UPI001C244948|nr:DUF2878 family protein [Aquihabitans sp. G128]QXC62768.1 DUF2878 family protein [Aquihabitans sp. G128]
MLQADDRQPALAPATTGVARWVPRALAAVGGGTAISVGDHLFHVRTRVLVHHWHPQWDGQTLVVFPIFMAAAALMLAVATPFVGRTPRPSWARVVLAGACFFAAYAFTGQVGTDHPAWCLVVLLATWLLRLAFEPHRRAAVLLGLLIGVGGGAGEAAVSALGLFTYVHQDVAGVPLWLLPLYLHGAPAVLALARLVQVEPDPT